jgi:hypothetical protein
MSLIPRKISLKSSFTRVSGSVSNVVVNDSVLDHISTVPSRYGILLGYVFKNTVYIADHVSAASNMVRSCQAVQGDVLSELSRIIPFMIGSIFPVGYYVVAEDDILANVDFEMLNLSFISAVNDWYPSDLSPLLSQSHFNTVVITSNQNAQTSSNLFCLPRTGIDPASRVVFPKSSNLWGELVPVSTVVHLSLPFVSTHSSFSEKQRLYQATAFSQSSWQDVSLCHIPLQPRPGIAVIPNETHLTSNLFKSTADGASAPETPSGSSVHLVLPLRAYVHASVPIEGAARALRHDLMLQMALLARDTPLSMIQDCDGREVLTPVSLERVWLPLAHNETLCLSALVCDGLQRQPAADVAGEADSGVMNVKGGDDSVGGGVRRRKKHVVGDDGGASSTSIAEAGAREYIHPAVFASKDDAIAEARAHLRATLSLFTDAGVVVRSSSRACITGVDAKGKDNALEKAQAVTSGWRDVCAKKNTEFVSAVVLRRSSIFGRYPIDVNHAIIVSFITGLLISLWFAQYVDIKF